MSESEQELAAFYQAHKDDPAVWDDSPEAPQTMPRHSGLGVTITVRFQADDVEALRRTAALENATYSDIIRKAVLRYIQPDHVFQANHEYTLPALETDLPRTLANPSPILSLAVSGRPITKSSAIMHPTAPAD